MNKLGKGLYDPKVKDATAAKVAENHAARDARRAAKATDILTGAKFSKAQAAAIIEAMKALKGGA